MVAAACVAVVLAFAGCGDDESEVDPAGLVGPVAPSGDIDPNPATLREQDGFTTLVSAQTRRIPGEEPTLVVAQTELRNRGQSTRFRLLIDGDRARDAQTTVVRDGGRRVAVTSCECTLDLGDHVITLEGATSADSARVGARSLIVFPAAAFGDGAGGEAVAASTLATDKAEIDADGTVVAEGTLREQTDQLLVLGAIRSDRTGIDPATIRLDAVVGDEPANDLVTAKIPGGKIVVLEASGEAAAGDTVELQAFTTAGQTTVGVAALALCPCGLDRTG